MAPLRIGVNALFLVPGGVGGTEIYLQSLLNALAEIDSENIYTVFTNAETGRGLLPDRPNFQHAPQWVRAAFRPGRLMWEQFVLPLESARRGIDVLFNPGFTAPVAAPCPCVTVFHDLQHKRHPEYFRWFDLPFWRLFLYLSAMRSRMLIADSEATREDLLKYYRVSPDKVRVVRLGVDEQMFVVGRQRDASRTERSILCVSTLHPHKNLNRLLEAFQTFRKERPEFRLVLAGMRGFHAEETERLIAQLGLQDAVEITGWIPRNDLYALFRTACAFVYPSTFEGFGLPLLEALAAGIPTGCSAIEPLLSISGGAALHFDPASTASIHQALERLTSDEALRARLAAAGPLRSAQFSWKQTAAQTLEVLTRAARG
jgi:glycosyltransferase involved in cell wall biosynthesis